MPDERTLLKKLSDILNEEKEKKGGKGENSQQEQKIEQATYQPIPLGQAEGQINKREKNQ